MSEFGTLKACSGKKYSSELSPSPIVVDIRAGVAVVDEVVGASGSAGMVIA